MGLIIVHIFDFFFWETQTNATPECRRHKNYFQRGMKKYFARNFEAVTDTTRHCQTAEIDTELTESSLILVLLRYEV